MRKSGLYIFLLCFFCAPQLQAQIPGYMGKKVYTGIEMSYSPNYAYFEKESYLANYQGKQSPNFLFNAPKIGFNLGCVVSRLTCFEVAVNYTRTGLEPYGSSPNRKPLVGESDYTRFSAVSFHLRLKPGIDHVAPIGMFVGPVFNIHKVQSESVYQGVSTPVEYSMLGSFGLTYGIRRVIKDQFLLDISCEIVKNFRFEKEHPYYGNDFDTWVHNDAIQKIRINSVFTGRLGIAYLF